MFYIFIYFCFVFKYFLSTLPSIGELFSYKCSKKKTRSRENIQFPKERYNGKIMMELLRIVVLDGRESRKFFIRATPKWRHPEAHSSLVYYVIVSMWSFLVVFFFTMIHWTTLKGSEVNYFMQFNHVSVFSYPIECELVLGEREKNWRIWIKWIGLGVSEIKGT